MFQTKGLLKTSVTYLNEMEISDLPDKEFKIMVIKMLIKVRKIMYEQSENFPELENHRCIRRKSQC